MNNFYNLLKEYNLKATPQRLAIVETLHEHGHLSVEDIYENLIEKFPTISLATVYKNINSMVEKMFLYEVKIPKSKSVYELAKQSHSHCYCHKCKSIKDMHLDTSSIYEQFKAKMHFETDNISIVITGICEECLNMHEK